MNNFYNYSLFFAFIAARLQKPVYGFSLVFLAYTEIDSLFHDYPFIINERLNSTLQITCLPSIYLLIISINTSKYNTVNTVNVTMQTDSTINSTITLHLQGTEKLTLFKFWKHLAFSSRYCQGKVLGPIIKP